MVLFHQFSNPYPTIMDSISKLDLYFFLDRFMYIIEKHTNIAKLILDTLSLFFVHTFPQKII